MLTVVFHETRLRYDFGRGHPVSPNRAGAFDGGTVQTLTHTLTATRAPRIPLPCCA